MLLTDTVHPTPFFSSTLGVAILALIPSTAAFILWFTSRYFRDLQTRLLDQDKALMETSKALAVLVAGVTPMQEIVRENNTRLATLEATTAALARAVSDHNASAHQYRRR
jgi:hypothetical protein